MMRRGATRQIAGGATEKLRCMAVALSDRFGLIGDRTLRTPTMNSNSRLVVYIDVDDTLVRSAGTKTMPVPSMAEHARGLASSGAELYCWSTAGAEYARSTALRLGIAQYFVAFLPKPHIVIDDQEFSAWKRFSVVHPMNAAGKSVDEYRKLLEGD
jgi:hypothetical protein